MKTNFKKNDKGGLSYTIKIIKHSKVNRCRFTGVHGTQNPNFFSPIFLYYWFSAFQDGQQKIQDGKSPVSLNLCIATCKHVGFY